MFTQSLAMATPPKEGGEGQPAQSSGIFNIGFLVFMVLIFYIIIIRPQRRREKERKALVASVQSGQRVLLAGGMIGEVCNVKDKTLIVRIAEKTKVEVLRGAVSQVLEKDETPDALPA